MAAARYWRLVGIETYAGGDLELSALHLYAGATRVDGTAALTCSHTPIAGTLADLQDADTATTCRFADDSVRSGGFSLTWDFGAGNTVEITATRPGGGGDHSAFMAGCTLQSSADTAAWVYAGVFGKYPWPGANTMSVEPAPGGDAEYAKVALLLKFDGSFADASPLAQSVTAINGSPGTTTTIKRFGTHAGDFRRTGAVAFPAGADFGTGDFTVEGHFYWSSLGGASEWGAFQISTPGTYESNTSNLALFTTSGGLYCVYCGGFFTSGAAAVTGVWQHIAVTRASGTVRLFVDGVNILQVTSTHDLSEPGGVLGGYYGGSYNGDLLIDEFRITKGVARYTGNFTPPSAPFPATTGVTAGDSYFANVVALLHADGDNGSTTFTDNSPAPKTFTANDGAAISTAQSKFGSASAYLNGTGAYFQTLASPDFAFPGDFTIEFWSWKSANGGAGYDTVATTDTSDGAAVNGWFLELSTVRGISMWTASSNVIKVDVNPNDSVWHHWAVTRAGSTVRAFKDGVLLGTSTYASDIAAAGPFGIGRSSSTVSYPFNGYIDDLRITKGIARYTGDFSPPSAPFPSSAFATGGIVFETLDLHTVRGDIDIAASAPVPAFNTRSTARLQLARDIEFGGAGTIYGTTKTKGTPNVPTKARVVLLHQRSKLPVRETWSDPVTGNFAFTGIDTTQQFLTLAEDAAGNFRPVAASRLTPEVAP